MSFSNISAIYQQRSNYYRQEQPDQAYHTNGKKGKRNSGRFNQDLGSIGGDSLALHHSISNTKSIEKLNAQIDENSMESTTGHTGQTTP